MGTRHIVYMSLTELKPATRNPKTHDAAAIAASLVRYGWTEPAVLDERTGRLVAGHGRREAAIRLMMTGEPLPGGMQLAENGDWMAPVLRGWSSRDDAEAEGYIIASNRLSEAGGWYWRGLAEMVEDVVTADAPLIETWGSDDEWMEEILRRVDPETIGDTEDATAPAPQATDPDDEDEEEGGVPGPDAVLDDAPVTTREVTCPACQHLFGVPA